MPHDSADRAARKKAAGDWAGIASAVVSWRKLCVLVFCAGLAKGKPNTPDIKERARGVDRSGALKQDGPSGYLASGRDAVGVSVGPE